MEGSIICMHQRCNMRLPVTLLVILQCTQHLQKGLVKTLTLAISYCVIGCCPWLVCPCDTTQLLDKVWLKVLTLVTVYSRRESIMNNEVVKQHPGCCSSRLIFSGKCLSVSRKMVCNNQNVLETTLWPLKGKIVQADDFQRCRGDNANEFSICILRCFTLYTALTLSHSLPDVRIHPWPKEALFDQRCCVVSALMTKVIMESSKNDISEPQWDNQLLKLLNVALRYNTPWDR